MRELDWEGRGLTRLRNDPAGNPELWQKFRRDPGQEPERSPRHTIQGCKALRKRRQQGEDRREPSGRGH